MSSAQLYDTIGATYTVTRCTEPRPRVGAPIRRGAARRTRGAPSHVVRRATPETHESYNASETCDDLRGHNQSSP